MLHLSTPDAIATGQKTHGRARKRAAAPSRHAPRLSRPVTKSATTTVTSRAINTADIGVGPLFVHARDAIVVCIAASGRIVQWNPAAERLFGYTAAEAIGKPVDMLMPPPVARLQRERLAHYARTGEADVLNARECLSVPVLTRDGKEIRTEVSLAPLVESDAACDITGPRYVLVIFRDATEEKRAELASLEAARAEAARAETEAKLHQTEDVLREGTRELGLTLARARRAASRLARMSQDATSRPERLAVLAWVVEARAAAVQRTIEQVDDMAAIQSGAFDVVGERVNLVPLIARVVAGIRSFSTQHRFHVGAPQGLTAVGDPRRIEQVVQILIDQAVRRNPRGCWIDVDLRRPLTGLARIEVRDYGRRLTPAERDHLPDQPSPDRQWYLCKHIVERHSGTLSVEFPDERGMRVSVTLPTNGGRLIGR